MVSVLATGLLVAQMLLLVATDGPGAAEAVRRLPEEARTVTVSVVEPRDGIDDARAAITDAVGGAFAAAEVPATVSAFSALLPTVPQNAVSARPAAAYLGRLDRIPDSALTSGSWPDRESAIPPDEVAVAVPASGAALLGLAVGSVLPLQIDDRRVQAVVVGVYALDPSSDALPTVDPLGGRGAIRGYQAPDTRDSEAVDAIGPLLVAPGVFAAADVPVAYLEVRAAPVIETESAGALARLPGVADDLSSIVAQSVPELSSTGTVTTSALPEAAEAVLATLASTRAAVASILVLLSLVAAVALAGVIRSLRDAHRAAHALMGARGASRRQLGALVGLDAAVIATAMLALGPPLGTLFSSLLRTTSGGGGSGLPAWVVPPPGVWAAAALLALAAIVLVVTPTVLGAVTFGRLQGRARLAARSGVDVALVALAALVLQQALTGSGRADGIGTGGSTVATGSAGTLDPFVIVAPAVALLAAALGAARLIGPALRVGDGAAGRTRGLVAALVGWGISRRSRRGVAIVTTLALALATAGYAAVLLDTWQRSQADQAAVAVGPPVRTMLAATSSAAAITVASPVDDTAGTGSALRRDGYIRADTGGDALRTRVRILGLDDAAATLLADGRTGEVGGASVADQLTRQVGPALTTRQTIELPADSVRIAMGVSVSGGAGGSAVPSAGDTGTDGGPAQVEIWAVQSEESGTVVPLPLGTVPLDGGPRTLAATLDPRARAIVGFQVRLDERAASGELGGIAVTLGAPTVSGAGSESAVLDGTTAAGWRVPTLEGRGVSLSVDGGSTRVLVGPPENADGGPLDVAVVAWEAEGSVPVVSTDAFAAEQFYSAGLPLALTFDETVVSGTFRGTSPVIPGSVPSDALLAGDVVGAGAGGEVLPTVVVRLPELSRALVERGAHGTAVDEIWSGSPLDDAAATTTAVTRDDVTDALTASPARVAVPSAMLLAVLTAALLAACGVAAESIVALRSRRTEDAHLSALGVGRGALLLAQLGESAALALVGAVVGLAIGVGLAALLAPAVVSAGSAVAAVPSVLLAVPVGGLALVITGVAFAVGAALLATTLAQRTTSAATLLRAGSDA